MRETAPARTESWRVVADSPLACCTRCVASRRCWHWNFEPGGLCTLH
eukprot:COSAG02_NODE_42089_length_388_cov_0.577855_1_plen_46_part_10